MRITRSSSVTSTFVSTKRTLTSSVAAGIKESKSVVTIKDQSSSSNPSDQEKPTKKRKVAASSTKTSTASSSSSNPSTSLQPTAALVDESKASDYTTLAFPSLPFSLDEARKHLIGQDVRFERLFEQIELKTYNELENGEVKELNIFRSLVTSILGQQISWLAARSIAYKFSRLFFPS